MNNLTTEKNESQSYHLPVLCSEAVEALVTRPEGIYVDVTMGGAGHTKAILQALGAKGHLYSLDRDPDAVVNAPEEDRFTFIASNFRHLKQWMAYYGVEHIDGILADLGVSSHHFDTAERGFSFRFEGAIPDMRMNNRAGITAAELLNDYTEEALADIFYYYGELRDARKIASLIVSARKSGNSFRTLEEVIQVIASTLPAQAQMRRRKLSQLFQALRIEVNDEFGALRTLLASAKELLSPGGRLVILTYHSLEDRIVKEWAKGNKSSEEEWQQAVYGTSKSAIESVSRKPIVPSEVEIERNPRARSAKMRILQVN